MTDPAKLKKWLTLGAVLYLLFPRDLIPDFLGRGLGFVDDLLLIAVLVYFYRSRLRNLAAGAASESGGREKRERSRSGQAAASEDSFDPYEVLGIPPAASGEAIRAAYKARMKEYHPDKVASLGAELQELAHRKSLEIQRAYQQLCP
ncbi:MAG: DnaJ domain-containing protein [Deltaproteobacteria bacterium]|nr:DnaJ domain-containing protein [Deltaproteobacteria bacterium]MBW2363142.1 DnaJ domain-containing protein [Deltaproteobacteria bacterium]